MPPARKGLMSRWAIGAGPSWSAGVCLCGTISSACAQPAVPAIGATAQEVRQTWGKPSQVCGATDPDCQWLRVSLENCDPQYGALAELWLYRKMFSDDVVMGVSDKQRVVCTAKAGIRLGL